MPLVEVCWTCSNAHHMVLWSRWHRWKFWRSHRYRKMTDSWGLTRKETP